MACYLLNMGGIYPFVDTCAFLTNSFNEKTPPINLTVDWGCLLVNAIVGNNSDYF